MAVGGGVMLCVGAFGLDVVASAVPLTLRMSIDPRESGPPLLDKPARLFRPPAG